MHNRDPEKQSQLAQIADEINDMMRDLFILAIANGFEDWNDIEWFSNLTKGHSEGSQFSKDECLDQLTALYDELTGLANQDLLNTNNLTPWLSRKLRSLGRFARSCNISFDQLAGDMHRRLNEDRTSANATLRNEPHPYISKGKYPIFKASIPDYKGTYRQLLQQVTDSGFDIWASRFRTVIYGEEAEAVVLLAVGSDAFPKDAEIDQGISRIREASLAVRVDDTAKYKPNRLLLRFSQVGPAGIIDAANELEFTQCVSKALDTFYKS